MQNIKRNASVILRVDLEKNDASVKGRSYDVIVERNALNKVGKYLNLQRKVLVITDRGVPIDYANAVCSASEHPIRVTVEPGEGSKSIENFESLLTIMLDNGFTRSDCVVAVGGGVVGDLAGFVASTFMRGVDFYNIPTTLLSQVDSSIGGKTAVNLGGIKNVVGTFYQPKKVIVDPALLETLPDRQMSNGFAEIIKMAVTFDKELFEILESEDIYADEILDDIIARAIEIKKFVVENDEKEQGLRRVLNFGHTIGHGIEYQQDLSGLYHGECVAIGMLPMCAPEIRSRVREALNRAGLPIVWKYDVDKIYNAVLHDKKLDGNDISLILSDEVGTYRINKIPVEEFHDMLKSTY